MHAISLCLSLSPNGFHSQSLARLCLSSCTLSYCHSVKRRTHTEDAAHQAYRGRCAPSAYRGRCAPSCSFITTHTEDAVHQAVLSSQRIQRTLCTKAVLSSQLSTQAGLQDQGRHPGHLYWMLQCAGAQSARALFTSRKLQLLSQLWQLMHALQKPRPCPHLSLGLCSLCPSRKHPLALGLAATVAAAAVPIAPAVPGMGATTCRPLAYSTTPRAQPAHLCRPLTPCYAFTAHTAAA